MLYSHMRIAPKGTPIPSESLKAESQALLTVIRDTIGRLILDLPHGWGSVTQLAADLGVERTLAWKLSRIGAAPDPFAVVQHLPGDRAMHRAWQAFAKATKRADLVDQASAALVRFRSLEIHVEDRASLNLLVGGHATRGREDIDLTQRRAAFRASSYLLGASAEMLYDATFVKAAAGDNQLLDMATIRGYRGLTRMRGDVAWPIARHITSVEPDGQVEHVGHPLAPAEVEQGVPVLKRFSSPGLPPLTRLDAPEGFARFALEPRVLGKSGALDVFIGERYFSVTRAVASAREPNHAIAVLVRTPCQVAVIEQFVHRASVGSFQMSTSALSLIFGEPTLAEIQASRGLRVPLFEEVEHLGPADRAAPLRSLPNYREMTAFGAAGMGCDLADMDLYRLTLRYPPEPTMIIMMAPFPA